MGFCTWTRRQEVDEKGEGQLWRPEKLCVHGWGKRERTPTQKRVNIVGLFLLEKAICEAG